MCVDPSQYRLWIAGQGGQGVRFLGEILTQAFVAEKRVSRLQLSCEWAIRGGQVVARVLADPRPEQHWGPAADYNFILYLHPQFHQAPPAQAPEALTLDAVEIGAWALAAQKQAHPGLNLIMLGALLARYPLCSEDVVAWVLKQKLSPHRLQDMPLNLEMLELGAQLL